MRSIKKYHRAFTLIEILIVVAIIAVISGSLWTTMVYYTRRAHTYQLEQGMQDEARLACTALIRDISNANAIAEKLGNWRKRGDVLILKMAEPELTRAKFIVYVAEEGGLWRYVVRDEGGGTDTHKAKIISKNLRDFSYAVNGKLIDFKISVGFEWQQREYESTFSSAVNLQ